MTPRRIGPGASTAAPGAGSRTVHRWVATVLAVFFLWFAVTGLAIQAIDLSALARHAPASDPDMMAMRESLDGPSNFAVIRTADYAAKPLPPRFDAQTALARTLASAAAALGPHAPLNFVEFRMAGDRPVAQVQTGDRLARFDALSGARLADAPPSKGGPPTPSLHQAAKRLHRLWALGDDMLWINALVGVGLGVMIVTGLLVYLRLLLGRRRSGRTELFWSAGGAWRTLHRGVSLVAAAFLLVVAVTGVLLSLDSLSLGLYRTFFPNQMMHGVVPFAMVGDLSTPLDPRRLPDMLATTLKAERAAEGDTPIKVIRLRTFAGYRQGVVVSARGGASQLIFNAETGAREGLSEPGYPYTGFPLGWRLHELTKRIHRGDALGVPGRLMDVFAALALVYLTVSGLVMYASLWRRRRRTGRAAPFWS